MLNKKIQLLSDKPGCYLMIGENKEILYIGKAKNLKKRVLQYFTKAHDGKTALLVSQIIDIDTIITNNEKDALLLEANLVRKHKPKYNVLLKDDKRFPYVKLSINGYPSLSIARHTKDKNAKYFGPFSNSTAAYKSIDLLNYIYPLKKCKSNSKEPCFYYHLGNCLGYCFKSVSKEEYEPYVKKVIDFYEGDTQEIETIVKDKMNKASANLEYEEASKYKQMLDYIDHLNIKQTVQLLKKENIDFFSAHLSEGFINITTFIYRVGNLINQENNFFELIGDLQENFESYIISYYQNRVVPKLIIVPNYLDLNLLSETLNTKVQTAKMGKKKEILDAVGQNAIKQLAIEFAKNKSDQIVLDDLAKILNIQSTEVIEMYDISHFSGEDAIGVKIAYVDGKPNKHLYRRYTIKQENTKDDLLNTREILYRRLYRIISENDKAPNLIILDGGITIFNTIKTLIDELQLNIPLASLVKNKKHETEALINNQGKKIILDKKSKLFYFLINMQEEVHRYAISSHINKRSKSLTSSILDEVKGLGAKRKYALLRAFGTLNEIKKASLEELSQYIPKSVAKALIKKLNS